MSVDDVVITPMHVERRLFQLGKELDAAHDELVECELTYMRAKAACEIAQAEKRMAVRQRFVEMGSKVTVQEVEDKALVLTKDELTSLNVAEARVRAARSNVSRLKVQIDIARSIGTSVRSSMEVS